MPHFFFFLIQQIQNYCVKLLLKFLNASVSVLNSWTGNQQSSKDDFLSVFDVGCAEMSETWFVTSRNLGFGGRNKHVDNQEQKILWVYKQKPINNILDIILICTRYTLAQRTEQSLTSEEFRKGFIEEMTFQLNLDVKSWLFCLE